jgi:hypothetical protein
MAHHESRLIHAADAPAVHDEANVVAIAAKPVIAWVVESTDAVDEFSQSGTPEIVRIAVTAPNMALSTLTSTSSGRSS